MLLQDAINEFINNPKAQYIVNDTFGGKKIIVDRNTRRIFDFNGNYFDMTYEMMTSDSWVVVESN